jgi:putative ABC transport system ATP-binding protein
MNAIAESIGAETLGTAPTATTVPAHATQPSPDYVIETTNLTKMYKMGDQEVHALRGVSMHVKRGEMVSIVGPSGSGKSTLMAIIGALDVPTAGSYLLDGHEISSMDDDMLSDIRNAQIGFVFQKFNLLGRSTALTNVALPMVYAGLKRHERDARAKQLLELVGLGDRLDHKPTELSGGQQQRVAIARALVNNPSILLADEPTGNLDSKTSEEIMALFRKLHSEQGVTLIIVTHSPEVAAQTDRAITLRDGLIVQA